MHITLHSGRAKGRWFRMIYILLKYISLKRGDLFMAEGFLVWDISCLCLMVSSIEYLSQLDVLNSQNTRKYSVE